MKKVLIITYYWPPSGSSSVQRVLKFAKYLPHFGWQPIVLTVNRGEYSAYDESLIKEIPSEIDVIRTSAFEPHSVYKWLTGDKKKGEVPLDAMAEKNASWKKKLSFWFRLNLFVPDSRIGWIPFAVRAGKKAIKKEKPDVIFSTAPPPTVHLIARRLAAWSGIKWVADFRDPWTNIHYLQTASRMNIAKKVDEQSELKVLNAANAVVAVSMLDIKNDFATKVSNDDKLYYIPNGFDEDDFKNFPNEELNTKKFKLAHIGTIGDERIPISLYKSISILAEKKIITKDNFELYLIGKVEQSNIRAYQDEGIEQFIKLIPYLSHEKIFDYYYQMSALLLLTYKTPKNIPGKTFEYIRTGKPIIAYGPTNGEAARVLSEIKGSVFIEYDDVKRSVECLQDAIEKFKNKKYESKVPVSDVQKFDRKVLTKKLADIFHNMTQD